MLQRLSPTCRTFFSISSNYKNHQKPPNSPPYQPEYKNLQKITIGSMRSIVEQRKKKSQQLLKQFHETLPSIQTNNFIKQHLCDVTLFMKYNQIQSQYVFALMNYQKLGFKKVSDDILLRNIQNYVEWINKKQPENIIKNNEKKQQWPMLKFSAPLEQTKFLIGTKNIIEFLNRNSLYRYQVQDDEYLSSTIQKYISENILPQLEYLFWHPKLTFQQLFHINITKNKSNMNYRLVSLFYSLMFRLFTRTVKNLTKIVLNRQKYLQSRQNLLKYIKQLTTMLKGKQFFGDTKPNHLDFYIFAVFNTKLVSKSFQNFLRNDVGGEFWDWLFRMRRLTQYDKQRVTLI